MKRLASLLILLIAVGAGLALAPPVVSPFPVSSLPRPDELASMFEEPSTAVVLMGSVLAWIMWLALLGYTISAMAGHITSVLAESRIENQVGQQGSATEGNRRIRKSNQDFDPQRSITISVGPRKVDSAA